MAQSLNTEIVPKNNSPFSRFGFGDLLDPYYAAASGMGGLSAAFHDPFHVNILNPASLAHLQATAFEVGFYGKYASLSGEDDSNAGVWSGNLNYLTLAFPIKNPINKVLDRDVRPFGWGMSLSLQPFSLVGYDILIEDTQPDVGLITNSLKGTGGTYRFYWGNAIRYKSVAFGANIGYFFGKISNSRLVQFDSLSNAYTTEFLDEISHGAFIWNAGIQVTHDFKKLDDGNMVPTGKRLIFGLYGNSSKSFQTNSSQFYHRDNFFYGIEDTISSQSDILQNGTLPSEITVGVTYEKINKLRLGIEYAIYNWSQYENEAKPEALADAYRIAFGGEIIPDALSYNKYSKRMRYRFGAFYSTDPRSVNGEQLSEYGITVGLGFPIIMPRQQTSFVNIGLEVGQFGVTGSLQETYAKMTLGFTLNDNTWFFKRKFN